MNSGWKDGGKKNCRNGKKDEWVEGRMDKPMDRRKHRNTEGRLEGWMDRLPDGDTGGQTHDQGSPDENRGHGVPPLGLSEPSRRSLPRPVPPRLHPGARPSSSDAEEHGRWGAGPRLY